MDKRLLLLVSLSALLTFSASAEVYKTTDKQGRVVYTDQPAASDTKAKIVELPSLNQLPPTEIIPVQDDAAPPAEIPNYQLEITSPVNGTRLMPSERSLTIAIQSENFLHPGYFFAYFLNGEKLVQTTERSFTLNEPPRGENKLYVAVVNQYGKVFGQSESVTVYVMRPTVKH